MDFSRLKSRTGISAILMLLSMFLPWKNVGFASASGWTVAEAGTVLSAFVYVVCLVPIGASVGIYKVASGQDVSVSVRSSGLVPLLLLLGMIFKLYDTVGRLTGWPWWWDWSS